MRCLIFCGEFRLTNSLEGASSNPSNKEPDIAIVTETLDQIDCRNLAFGKVFTLRGVIKDRIGRQRYEVEFL